MSEAFTPGPWPLVEHGERDSRVGAKTLLAIVYSEAFLDRENQKANANLIAAAPDLYEALEYFAHGGHFDHCAVVEHGNDCDCGVAKARAALAKAKGEMR